MKVSRTEWDVVIAGGGPAGSTAAALLAEKGFRVLLAEKERFPRFHTGESMLPASWGVLWKLGLAEKMEASGQQRKIGARFNLFGEREFTFGLARPVLEFLPENRGKFHAWNCLRSEFDLMLLENARERGAEIVQPATVEKVIFSGSRATGAVLADESGDRTTVQTKVVVDATGRDCLISRALDLRHPDPTLNKIAYFAHYEGCYRPPEEFLPIWLLAFEGGWVWYFSLMQDLTSVGVVVDAEYARTHRGRDREAFFKEAVANVPYVTDWVANARRVSDMYAISALSYMSDRFVGDGWLLAGDSAGFVDPIFSAGIHLALKCGDVATETIVKAFAAGDFSAETLAPYETTIRQQMGAIFPMIYRWYEALRSPRDAVALFDSASRFSWLQRKVNLSLVGAWDAIVNDPRLSFGALMSRSGRERDNDIVQWGSGISPTT